MNTDDKIRAILRLEADTVEPSAAGWDAIQAGVARRGARTWWTRGAALAGAAAVVVGAGAYVATSDRSPRGIDQVPATSGPSVSTSPLPSASASPSPTATPPSTVVDEPIHAIWPLTTTREVADWQADEETYPALRTARGAALAFARNYLGVPDATVVGEERFGESDYEIRTPDFLVSRVHVIGHGEGGTAPFVVTRAEADPLRIAEPEAATALAGRVTVRGTYEGVDPGITVRVRADGGGTAPVELATQRAGTGPSGWSASLEFTTRATTGSILVTLASGRDGSVAAAAAVPVTFGRAPATTAGPAEVVATRDGRIAVLSAATGKVVRWLTAAGARAFDPQLTADGKTVVYAQGTSTPCRSDIRSVPVGGGTPKTLATGGGLSGPSLRDGVLAYVRSECEGNTVARQFVEVRSAGPRQSFEVGGTLRGDGVVAGERFVAYLDEDGAMLHLPDAYGEFADSPRKAPDGCAWTALTWGARDVNDREQLFATAACESTPDGATSYLYRMDADGQNVTRLEQVDVPDIVSMDFAGEHLVFGSRAHDSETSVYSYVGGVPRLVPGYGARPSWH